jgi:hypothetical protein
VFLASLPWALMRLCLVTAGAKTLMMSAATALNRPGRDDARFSWPHDTDEARVVGALDELH